MVRWFVLLAACGKTSPAAPDAPADVPADTSRMISGRDVVRAARCVDTTHVPAIVEGPWHSLAIATDTGPIAVAADDSFTFTAPSGAFRLTVTEDGYLPEAFDLDTTTIDLAARYIGR